MTTTQYRYEKKNALHQGDHTKFLLDAYNISTSSKTKTADIQR